MVYTYFEIGRLIVEEEQEGSERAAYGKRQLTALSERLIAEFGKGYSVSNLEYMRGFYLSYRNRIPQSLTGKPLFRRILISQIVMLKTNTDLWQKPKQRVSRA